MMKKFLVFIILLAQTNIIIAQFTAEITKTWVEVNAVENGNVGVRFHFNARVTGAGKTNLFVLAAIDNPPGCGIQDNNGSYRISNGVIGNAIKLLTGSGQKTVYFNDAKIWIPLSELQVPAGAAKTLYVHYALVRDEDPLLNYADSNVLQWTDFLQFTVVGTGNASQNDSSGHKPEFHAIVCPICNGGGTIPYRNYATCPSCGGTGMLTSYQ